MPGLLKRPAPELPKKSTSAKVPRRVDIEKPGTACLNVLRQKDSSLGRRGSDSSKVAPGMDATFIVHFQPASADDYKWDLVVRTERERFLVPVSGTGRRALLEMPSALDFPKTPVKQDSSRSFMITNTGTREARFVLACQAPFTASPTEALLAVGASMRCKMAFKPQTTGFEVDVEMTPGPIRVPSSFIRNQSQGSFKIINCSKVPLKFEWRNHGSEEDDRHSAAGPDGGSAGPDGLTEGSTPASESDFSQDAGDSEYEEHVLLSRKAVDLHERHAAERRMVAHRQFFHNAAFSLQPLQGCVWPESEAEMTVIFHPSQAENLSATAWCVIEGRQERIPVQLEGRGLGPDAGFAREALDVGEAYIHTAHNYEMQILNKGSIEATFGLLPNTTPFGSKFTFEPTGGSLPVGQSMTITARLMAGTLGPFNESFNFFIEGSSKLIRLQIKGKVVAPSFQVDLTTIDWGPVTSGFTFTKTLTLTNTSKVNMAYAWSVPEDSIDPTKAIFKISPSSGKLSHGKHTDIVIEYQCAAPFEFQYHLMMGIPNVNRSAVHMAMRAEYVVPIVRIPERIDFGRCSIRSPYTQALVLVNQGKMPAKYQITSLAAHELATLTAEAMSGEIPARGEANVAITLCALHLGRMTLTAHVQVVGMANDHPKKILIGALSIGATLMAQTPSGQPKLAGTDIAFGSVPVLKETIQKLRIVNPGPIPASFSMSMETRDSPFKVQPLTAELIPNEELELEIMVNPDQTKLLRDTLHVIINEGDDLMFPTTAVGAGQLITCDASTAGVDFGHQFIGWQSSREVLVRNHSRKSVTLIWDNATIKEQVVRSKRSGTNQPKQAVDLDFCFYAPEYSDAQAVAVCDVENGPTYRIPMSADTGDISFKVQDATMDFGPVPYDDVSQLNIVLRSTGLVPFSFFAELDAPGDPAYCSLFPRQGDLTHGTSAIMSLKIRPGAPRKLEGAVIILVEGKEPLKVNIEEMTLDADADQRRLTKLIVDGVAGHLGHRESNARGLRHTSSISGASGHRQSVAGTRSHRPSAMGEQDRYRQSNAEDMGHGSQSRRPSVSGSADSMRHRPSVGGDQRHRPSMMDDGHGEPASHRPSMGGDQRHHRPSHAGGIDHQDNGPLSHRQSTYGESAAHGLVEHRESMAHGLEHRESMAGTLSHRPSAMGDMSHRQSTLGDMSHRSSVARGGHRGRGPQGQDAAHHNTHPPATVHPWETTIHLQSGRVHQAFAAYILDFGNIARQQSK
ncbi:hypothetical protein WJX84_004587, partial [Apatococcus fuscideae]